MLAASQRYPEKIAPQRGGQKIYVANKCFELLAHGERGGGKTTVNIIDYCRDVGKWGHFWRGILFRRTYPELSDVIQKSHQIIPKLHPGAKWVGGSTPSWTFPGGEALLFRQIKRDDEYWKYHGHEYPWICFEELTTWNTPVLYKRMMTCCRSSGPKEMPRKMRSSTNPSGPGHNWVKLWFQLPGLPGKILSEKITRTFDFTDEVRTCQAVKMDFEANLALIEADPGYQANILMGARNAGELAAWKDGDWDIVSGGMFDDVWDKNKHIVPDFEVPSTWRIDRAFDWGSSKPFSVGWWAESDGSDVKIGNRWFSTIKGDLFRIAEWYGWTGEPNEGLRMLAVDITKGIVEREMAMGLHGRVKAGVADSAIFTVENGESIAIDMGKPVLVNGKMEKGVQWLRADKSAGSRITGWEMVRKRMMASAAKAPREYPGLFVCAHCDQFLRTIPTLQRDLEKNPDDVNTDTEDHIADEVRYRVRFSTQRPTGGRVKGTPS